MKIDEILDLMDQLFRIISEWVYAMSVVYSA